VIPPSPVVISARIVKKGRKYIIEVPKEVAKEFEKFKLKIVITVDGTCSISIGEKQ